MLAAALSEVSPDPKDGKSESEVKEQPPRSRAEPINKARICEKAIVANYLFCMIPERIARSEVVLLE